MLAESCWSPACIHHSTSLHFPLSSLCLICLLEFLSAQLFKKKINKSSPYFTSLSPSALLSFVFLPIRLPSSYFPLLLSFFFLDYHLSFCILSCSPLPFFFFPSPLARLFLLTIRLSLLSKPQIVGSELSSLVSISWLINVS